MYGKGTQSVLEGLEIGAVTKEISLENCHKAKNKSTVWPSYIVTGTHPKCHQPAPLKLVRPSQLLLNSQ